MRNAIKAVILISQIVPMAFGTELRGLSAGLEVLSETVSPSVVEVAASGYGPLQDGGPTKVSIVGRRRSTGSGVIVDASGYILTNAHVVANRQRVRVSIPGRRGTSWVDAKIVGQDEETDLALLKVERRSSGGVVQKVRKSEMHEHEPT